VAHPFLIKEIALQAGLSEATVDRVLNKRGGVRRHTAQRVKQAIRELDGQIEQAGLSGRKFLIDVVMQSPDRFSESVRAALDDEMPTLRPAVFRARYHFSEVARTAELAAVIDRIAARGTHGLFLKAPDQPEIAAAVDRVVHRGIPVVTLVTDVANCRRAAYVGMDNRAAGETAAYLIGEWLGDARARILTTLSSNSFRGEEEREIGFRRALRMRYPNLGIVDVSEGLGIDRATGALARKALAADPNVIAAYSIGGGNRALVEAFQAMARPCQVFVGHDLDADNLALLREKRISAVLHHDLNADVRSACRIVMQAHRVLPQGPPPPPSQVQVITPFNLPAARGREMAPAWGAEGAP
jgi:LacI family transcriptional regulator